MDWRKCRLRRGFALRKFSLRATGCLLYPDAPEFFMQGENGGWRCAARREITERSEEAPAAKDAQPSKGDGRGKARRVLRGECRGGLGGAQPLTGPLCRTPRRRPKQDQRKSLRARRAAVFLLEGRPRQQLAPDKDTAQTYAVVHRCSKFNDEKQHRQRYTGP